MYRGNSINWKKSLYLLFSNNSFTHLSYFFFSYFHSPPIYLLIHVIHSTLSAVSPTTAYRLFLCLFLIILIMLFTLLSFSSFLLTLSAVLPLLHSSCFCVYFLLSVFRFFIANERVLKLQLNFVSKYLPDIFYQLYIFYSKLYSV